MVLRDQSALAPSESVTVSLFSSLGKANSPVGHGSPSGPCVASSSQCLTHSE